MQVRNFTQEEILNLPCICGTTSEGDIILNDDKVIKMIRSTNGSYFSNKLFTIHALLDSIDLPEIEELVLPEKLRASITSFIVISFDINFFKFAFV